jgi:hypothetical protein
MSVVGEMTTVARRKIGKTYLGLWVAIFLMLALVTLMWICNITGAPGWALLIGTFGMFALAFISFAPKTIFIFLGFGALVAELKDEDITQGTLKGVGSLYRVFLALGYAFMGMSGLLGTWSFAKYPAAFWVIAFFGTFLLILLAHNKVTLGKWMLFLCGGYAIAVILWMIGMTVFPEQKGSAPATLNDTVVEGAAKLGIGTLTPEQAEEAHQAKVVETRRQAELDAAAIASPPARTEATKITYDCRGQYKDLTNCRNVKFGVNEIYHTEVQPTIDPVTKKEKAWCTFADPVDAGYWEHIAGRQFAFIPYNDNGPRVTFFEVKEGEKSFTGVPCG